MGEELPRQGRKPERETNVRLWGLGSCMRSMWPLPLKINIVDGCDDMGSN